MRTELLRDGMALSDVTAQLREKVGVDARILPASDDRLRTYVHTPAGPLMFQEWFVARAHEDEVDSVSYEGAEGATAAPGVLEAFAGADAIVIAPSNPYLSIGPILAVDEIRAAIESRAVRCVAVSPLVGGKAVSGPVDRMLLRMGGGTTPAHVTDCYLGLIDALVIDETDAPAEAAEAIEADVELVVTRTLMSDRDAARRLAKRVLETACG